MNKKKIYFLINSLEWWWAERVITTIGENLNQNSDITIITLKNINFFDLPSHVHYLPLSNIKNNLLMFLCIPYYVYKLRKILRKHAFDWWMSSLEIANFVHILANKNAKIAFETSIYFFTGIVWFVHKMLIKWLYPKAASIKVNSEENQYSLAKYLHIPEHKIQVIYNPIDLKKIEEKKYESIPQDVYDVMQWKRVFITTGRLISSKHHAKIISALKMVYDKLDKNWIFLILSDWPQRKILEQQVSDLWLKKHIYFLGLQKNVFKYLYAADWFLYASEVEWFPNVLIEAMACNLFILTSHFKTWAEECILWHYKNSINTEIKYPYYGPNGVLFDLLNYENDFFEVYKHLDSIKKEKKGFEKFDIQKICTQILAFMC